MPNYGEAQYWDERYKEQEGTVFDWLKNWADIKETIEQNAIKVDKSEMKILNIGCGNSPLCEEMYDEGYKHIYNMDISSVCIQ